MKRLLCLPLTNFLPRYRESSEDVNAGHRTLLLHLWDTATRYLHNAAACSPTISTTNDSTKSSTTPTEEALSECLVWLKQLAKFPERFLSAVELHGPLETNMAWCLLQLGDAAGAVHQINRVVNEISTGMQGIRLRFARSET